MILFISLNLIDCILTFYGLKEGLVEGNLLLSSLFDSSILLGMAVKMLLCLLIALLLIKFKKEKLFKILNIAFTLIIVWNVFVILIVR